MESKTKRGPVAKRNLPKYAKYMKTINECGTDGNPMTARQIINHVKDVTGVIITTSPKNKKRVINFAIEALWNEDNIVEEKHIDPLAELKKSPVCEEDCVCECIEPSPEAQALGLTQAQYEEWLETDGQMIEERVLDLSGMTKAELVADFKRVTGQRYGGRIKVWLTERSWISTELAKEYLKRGFKYGDFTSVKH